MSPHIPLVQKMVGPIPDPPEILAPSTSTTP
jgi:hypothetical protein